MLEISNLISKTPSQAREETLLQQMLQPLKEQLQLGSATEHKFSGPSHEHMIICFPPIDLQRPTRQVNPV